MVSKAHVRDTLRAVSRIGDTSGIEIAMMEEALAQLHEHRDEIRKHARMVVRKDRGEASKQLRAVTKASLKTGEHVLPRSNVVTLERLGDDPMARAIAKTALKTGVPSSQLREFLKAAPKSSKQASGMQWVDTSDADRYQVEGYWRKLQRGEAQTKETKAKVREMQLEENLRTEQERHEGSLPRGGEARDIFGPTSQKLFDSPAKIAFDSLAEVGTKVVEDEVYQGAIKSFLSERSYGQGIVAVANFLSSKTDKFKFAAKAISQFGPMTGTRMAYAYFRYGGYDVPMKQQNGDVVTEMGDKLPKPVTAADTRNRLVQILSKRLPGAEADDSGAEPPSEGFIIDRHGNVLAHGVGRGKDHFLPFSTKHLRSMRRTEGVEYVRRRMFGGPTIEDLHAAMMMGVDRLTVVSNSGTFTIGLSERSHGIKMEHTQILNRYRDILDKHKRLDFQAYESALSALQSEFPLHVFTEKIDVGDSQWKGKHDRISNVEGFVDQLKEAFDVLGDGDRKRSFGVGFKAEDIDRTVRETGRLPGQTSTETVQQFYRRKATHTEDRRPLLNQVAQYYRTKGTDPGKVGWLREEITRLQAQRTGAISGERVVEPGPVSTWKDPARVQAQSDEARRARQSQPSASLTFPPGAKRRLQEVGLNTSPSKLTTENARNLAFALEATANNEDAWEALRADRDWMKNLSETFAH